MIWTGGAAHYGLKNESPSQIAVSIPGITPHTSKVHVFTVGQINFQIYLAGKMSQKKIQSSATTKKKEIKNNCREAGLFTIIDVTG